MQILWELKDHESKYKSSDSKLGFRYRAHGHSWPFLEKMSVGIFVCTGGFTRDAEGEVRNQEKRRLMLVDLSRLFDLWVEHYDRLPEENRRLLATKVSSVLGSRRVIHV